MNDSLVRALLVVASATLTLSPQPAHAQTILFTREFTQASGLGPAKSPMVAYSGAIYVTGTFSAESSNFTHVDRFQTLLRKYDAQGRELWTRPLTGPDNILPFAIAADFSGIYVAGQIGMAGADAFIGKFSLTGDQLWLRAFHHDGPHYEYAFDVATDPSGVYIAASNGNSESFVRKYSPEGNELWTRTLAVGGIATDNFGVYVVAGSDQAAFLRKYNRDGDELWTCPLASDTSEFLAAGRLTADSTSVYLAGTTSLTPGAGDGSFGSDTRRAFLRRFDSSGNEVWARRFETLSLPIGLALDSDGVYVAGQTQTTFPGQCKTDVADAFVRSYSLAGEERWTRQFGWFGGAIVYGVGVDSDAVYVSGVNGGVFVAKLEKASAPIDNSRPHIQNECVVNAASFYGGGVAPGEMVTIFGGSIGPATPASLQVIDGRVADTLADTRILFNEIPAPLLYVSATQTNAIVPYEVAGKDSVIVQVEYKGVRSAPLLLAVLSARPGIFTRNGSGSGQGLILNEDGSFNSPETPAKRGSLITMFVTGDGATDSPVADGTILGATSAKPQAPISVSFDNPKDQDERLESEIVSAAGLPGSAAGLLQIKFRVPQDARSGPAVPFLLKAGSRTAAPGVTVALQ